LVYFFLSGYEQGLGWDLISIYCTVVMFFISQGR
jgi:hypothetical protein